MHRRVRVTALCLLLMAVIMQTFVYPVDVPRPSDAIVLLAGDATTRLPLAVRLAEEGPGVLVISRGGGADNAAARELCERPGELVVHCFTPGTSDTRSEARAIGQLITEHDWHRITLVTSSYHVARALLLVARCTEAEVQSVYAREEMSVRRWASALLHEIGGLTAAGVDWRC
jgi:uncharacterized SAM-binding protein YcdF (DUF218 family)